MQFDELLVTTKVDALVRLVKEKGTIEVGMAARFLDVSTENVEEWTHILEEEGIIKVDYHLTKAYLTWIKPSKEEIAREEETFYKKKEELLRDVASLKVQMAPKEKELEELKTSFSTIYEKLFPQIEKLQLQVAALSSLKGKGSEKLGSNLEKLGLLNKRAEEISNSLVVLKKELGEMKKELKEKTSVEPKFREIESMKRDLSALGDKLKDVDGEIASLQKSLPKEKFDKETVQKSVELLKHDFTELKKSNVLMRENIRTLKEAFDVLDAVNTSIAERTKRIVGVKKEMQSLLSSIKDIQNKGNELSESVKSEIGAVDGFMESVEFAKMALSKFPSQKEFMAKMEELIQNEKSLETRIGALEKNVSIAPPAGVPLPSVEEILKLKEELDEKRKLLSKEVGELFSAVEEESSTYSTFQKIKERALTTIEDYSATIQKMESELKVLSKETEKVSGDIDSELAKMKGKIDDKALQELIKGAGQVEQKKALLEDVAESLEALSNAADNITRKLNLLSKEAEILSLRKEGPGISRPEVEKIEKKEDMLRQQLSLTKNEQVEFDRKREELKELIKKLWEQS